MRIWIEAGLVARHGGGGSRRYAERLASGLASAGEDVTVLADRPDGFEAPVRSLRGGTRSLHAVWAFARWPSLTAVAGGPPPDLVHVAEKVSVPPVPAGIPLAVTVHDVWCVTRRCRGKLGFLVRRAWRTRDRWDLVLTGTEAVKDQLADLGIGPERVTVTPYGVGEAFLRPPPDPAALRSRLGLHEPNLVFVGPLSRKKGADILLEAFRRLRGAGHPDLRLVVRGPEGFEEVAGLLGPGSLDAVRAAVRFVPPLPDEELASLYAQASAVVCPSRDEGYAFPLVEALSLGARAVASDIPVHREVARGSAALVEPGDADALAAGIEGAIVGRVPAAPFDPPRWERTVELTLEAYHRTVAGARPGQ